MMHLYRICGMNVASEIALPGAWHLASGEPDVVMRQGRVPPALVDPVASRRFWDANANHFLLRFPAGRFLISHGREVTFEPAAETDAEGCAIYLQGSVIGQLLNQRGGIVLHASAVAMGGMAVLFCGASGEGKSTLAAALSLRGHPLIGDDIASISFDRSGRPMVGADARQMKLTDVSINAMDLDSQRDEPVPGNVGKTYVRPQAGWSGADLPLGAVYVLQSGADADTIIRPLDVASALQKLRHNAYRPGIVRHTGQMSRYFDASARIIRYAGIFMIDRPRDLARLPETAAAIEDHRLQIAPETGE